MLQFVDPTVLSSNKDSSLQEDGARVTPLHHLADLLDPNDYSTHESQIILAKQLIGRGADVNAASIPKDDTPLQKACSWYNVTNLDFVEYLLEGSAYPNVRDYCGMILLMCVLW
jgi:ankyrin repeat protein